MKKFISVLLILTMIMSITACGNQEGSTRVEATTTAEATTKISESALETDTEKVDEGLEESPEEEGDELESFENLYPNLITDETDTWVTYIDKFGTETRITKEPKKVVVLYNSLLGLWYYMGGESLTKVKGSSNVPEEAVDLVDLGSSSSVSLEAVIAFEPDLVVISGNIDNQVAMAANLNEMGIETMIIDAKTKSYERFTENAYLFSKVLGTQDVYTDKTAHVIEEVNAMIATAASADQSVRVAPLFATSKSISVETDMAQIGEIVSLLGGENIYSEDDLIAEGETRIPFSIEAIVTQNPEVILISTMGSVDSAKETIDAMIAENPVWKEVDAVKNDRVFYLDKELSVYKPNQRYAEAFQMVAERIYPEFFQVD